MNNGLNIPALFPQPMILMKGPSWQNVDRDDLGSLLGGAGYTNCYLPPQYEGKDSASNGNHQIFTYTTSATTITHLFSLIYKKSSASVIVLKP